MNIAQLFETLGIAEFTVDDDVKFLRSVRGQLHQFEQLPVVHDPKFRNKRVEARRCVCTNTTRVRVRVSA